MKTRSINLSVVKNIGNFQTVRYSIEIETETATEAQAFAYAKKVIEEAHKANYDSGLTADIDATKNILGVNSPEFQMIKKELLNGDVTLRQIMDYYVVSNDALKVLEGL